MQEVYKETNGKSNGTAYHIEAEEDAPADKQIVTHFTKTNGVIEQNVEEHERQKAAAINPEMLGRKSVDVRYAIGLLDEVINNEDDDDDEVGVHETKKFGAMALVDSRKISLDAVSLTSNNVHVVGSDFALVHREDAPGTPVLEMRTESSEVAQVPEENVIRHTDVIQEEDEVSDSSTTSQDADTSPDKEVADHNKEEEKKNADINIPPESTETVVAKANLPVEETVKPPATPPPPPPVPQRLHRVRNFVLPTKGKTPSPQSSPRLNEPKPTEGEPNLEDPQLDDHVKIGSQSHNVMAKKLEKMLQFRNERTSVGLTKPIHHEEEDGLVRNRFKPADITQKNSDMVQGLNRLSAIIKDDKPTEKTEGIEESAALKPSDFKRKLNELMSVRGSMTRPRKTASEPPTPEMDRKITEEPETDETEIESKTNRPEDEILKHVMGNVFKSIKLRKVDSFRVDKENDTEEPKPDEPKIDLKTNQPEDAKLKNVMGNVFQSIKLRKVDSFKVDKENGTVESKTM